MPATATLVSTFIHHDGATLVTVWKFPAPYVAGRGFPDWQPGAAQQKFATLSSGGILYPDGFVAAPQDFGLFFSYGGSGANTNLAAGTLYMQLVATDANGVEYAASAPKVTTFATPNALIFELPSFPTGTPTVLCGRQVKEYHIYLNRTGPTGPWDFYDIVPPSSTAGVSGYTTNNSNPVAAGGQVNLVTATPLFASTNPTYTPPLYWICCHGLTTPVLFGQANPTLAAPAGWIQDDQGNGTPALVNQAVTNYSMVGANGFTDPGLEPPANAPSGTAPSGAVYTAGHDGTSDGTLTGTQTKLFVSSTHGNDGAGHFGTFADPFATQAKAVAAAFAIYGTTANNLAILSLRGDSWTLTSSIPPRLNGLAWNKPVVYGTYWNPAYGADPGPAAAPTLNGNQVSIFNVSGAGGTKQTAYQLYRGLNLVQTDPDNPNGAGGIGYSEPQGSPGLYVDDCRITGFTTGILTGATFQYGGYHGDVWVNRTVIAYSNGPGGAQGAEFEWALGLDQANAIGLLYSDMGIISAGHNSVDPYFSTSFCHGTYSIIGGGPTLVKSSVIADCSNNGMMSRPGGIHVDDYFGGNSSAGVNFDVGGTWARNFVELGPDLTGSPGTFTNVGTVTATFTKGSTTVTCSASVAGSVSPGQAVKLSTRSSAWAVLSVVGATITLVNPYTAVASGTDVGQLQVASVSGAVAQGYGVSATSQAPGQQYGIAQHDGYLLEDNVVVNPATCTAPRPILLNIYQEMAQTQTIVRNNTVEATGAATATPGITLNSDGLPGTTRFISIYRNVLSTGSGLTYDFAALTPGNTPNLGSVVVADDNVASTTLANPVNYNGGGESWTAWKGSGNDSHSMTLTTAPSYTQAPVGLGDWYAHNGGTNSRAAFLAAYIARPVGSWSNLYSMRAATTWIRQQYACTSNLVVTSHAGHPYYRGASPEAVAPYATAYALAAPVPAYGPVGTPSANFTLALGAGTTLPLWEFVPVGLAPAGAPGTLSTTSTPLSAWTTTKTFTFTPSAIGQTVVTTSSAGILADGNPATYNATFLTQAGRYFVGTSTVGFIG